MFLEEIYIPGNFQLFISLLGFPHSSVGKESAGNAADTGLIPVLWRPAEEGHGNPLLYSCLEKSMDRGAWRATVMELQRVRHGWVSEHGTFYSNQQVYNLMQMKIRKKTHKKNPSSSCVSKLIFKVMYENENSKIWWKFKAWSWSFLIWANKLMFNVGWLGQLWMLNTVKILFVINKHKLIIALVS